MRARRLLAASLPFVSFALFVGCGGDNAATSPPDAGDDAGVDATTNDDAAADADAAIADGAVTTDADAAPPPDSSGDDAPLEGASDTGPSDAGDSGDSSVLGDSGDSSAPGDSGDAAGAADAADASAGVSGVGNMLFITDTGVVTVPFDLTTFVVEAYAASGDGGFTRYPAVALANGTFTIPGVPAGEYTLHFSPQGAPNDSWFLTTARVLDMSGYFAGRPDATPAPAGTTVKLSATGLDPWNPAGDFQITSSNPGFWLSGVTAAATAGAPAPGDTSLSNMTLPWDQLACPILISAASGDSTFFTELTPAATDAGGTYNRVTKALAAPTFSVASGAATSFSGAFAAVAPTEHVTATWKHAAFDALGPQTNPNATLAAPHGLTVDVTPYGFGRGRLLQSNGYADLLTYGSGATGDEMVDLAYGDPFPGAWSEFAGFDAQYRVPLAIPLGDGGVSGPFHPRAVLFSLDHVPSPGATVTPRISPVKNPRVSGKDGFAIQSGTGTSPTISWDPPDIGTPSFTLVAIAEVHLNASGNTRPTPGVPTIQIGTTGTSVTLPPGLLAAGKWYFVELQTISMPGGDPLAKPLLTSYPFAAAQTMLNLFTP